MKVSLQRLTKQFQHLRVLDEVSVEFPPGQITVLLGANGAGKTTLLRCLSGLADGTSGAVLLDGEPLKSGRLDLRRRLMFLPDFPPALPAADLLEQVAMQLNVWQADRPGVEERVAAWIDEYYLAPFAGSHVGSLSRGQNYKAALIGLFAVDPELWLLDEPFASGMDAPGIGIFRREVRAAAARGRTIIYSTQLVELAAAFSDHIAVVGRGGLRFYDTESDFGRDPARIEEHLITPDPP